MTVFGSCHSTSGKTGTKGKGKRLTIALAGNANVGKSVIFNQLTGSSQIIGNWPGKTVERALGTLQFGGYDITIVDLPGIYSLSTFSLEELVTRQYLASEKPDVAINVVDASVLERNLFFTLQLMEMEVPLVVCVNQMDLAKRKGILIDTRKLEASLGVPVVPTVAIKGQGIRELVERAIETAEHDREVHDEGGGPKRGAQQPTEGPGRQGYGRHGTATRFGDGLEEAVGTLTQAIEAQKVGLGYPARWLAVKLLEDDPDVTKLVMDQSPDLASTAKALAQGVEATRQESPFALIAADRYSLAARLAYSAQKQEKVKATLSDRLDRVSTHRVLGYVTSALILVGLLLWTFTVGNYLSGLLSTLFSFLEALEPKLSGSIAAILWNGAYAGFVAGVTLVIPYVIPFYLAMGVIEDSGILTRVAFMFDNLMHKIGLHGKAIIPLVLGYGCNVPAIYACRIMGTTRERLLGAFAVTLIPCTARTIVILGLVAAFVGIQWALALYAIDLVIVFILGRLALKVVPGNSAGLIMEMHSFRVPSLPVVVRQTWARTKPIIGMVFPIYVLGGAMVQGLYASGWLDPINRALSPITVGWLGLPVVAGALLIFGLVRKEMILLALVPIFGSPDLNLFLAPYQLITLALIGILYFPCLATFTVLVKEFGWKPSLWISLANLVSALVIAGLAVRLLAPLF
ncbi:MAG: ferrous iron transport protein B [Chloroflexota bacterium]